MSSVNPTTSDSEAEELRRSIAPYICKPMHPGQPNSDPAVTRHLQEYEARKLDTVMEFIAAWHRGSLAQAEIKGRLAELEDKRAWFELLPGYDGRVAMLQAQLKAAEGKQ